jgi:WD40 repeat protein/tRNA A-37 threonylcarbamoyl transferase component Bud32
VNSTDRYSALSDDQLQQVHAACERFELALRNEKPIRIEDCLAAVAEGIRGPLFHELLAIELEQVRCVPSSQGKDGDGRDQTARLAEYRARFPDRLGDIEQIFQEESKTSVYDGTRETGRAEPERGAAALSVPGYEIEGVLGRGGMGVVYKARHLKLKRTVALKMVLAGRHAGPRELARFLREAEAVARLQHPNIVQIHEVDEAGGHPYCALEFVEGGNLAGKLDGKPLPAREAAKLVEVLARAMQLAHSRNVVHRDLKPANILLTIDGTPKITDFGLARQLDTDSGETQAGAVMGTPSYMAPEQATGHAHEAGPAADVYALGAILYDCLTGQPPFKGSTAVETLDLVRSQEPTAPSRRQSGVPLDLDTICLKCLSKEPENRYTSAAELADELVRYLHGQPLLARPVGRIERARKWVRRNPMVAASLAGLVGIIVTAFLLVSWSYFRAENAREEESVQRQAADEARDAAQREQKAERWGRYRSDIAAAAAAVQLQNNSAARRALEDAPERHRNWEWRYLHSQLDGARFVLSVPGKRIDSIILSPSGRQIAALGVSHDEVYLYDVATAKLDAVLRGHAAQVTSLAYRPDGKQIVTSGEDQTARVWDSATGRELALFRTESALPKQRFWARVSYNADGSRIATFTAPPPGGEHEGGTSRLWDAATGNEIAVLVKWRPDAGPVEFSPDGMRIAVSSGNDVDLCDAVTGRRLAGLGPHATRVVLLCYSPDGKRLASTADPVVYLWDGETGNAVAVMRDHRARVNLLRFSPDGSRLLSAGDYPDNTARLWDAATGQSLAVLAGHKNVISAMAFSPDGQRVATASTDQTARLWNGTTGLSLAVLRGHTGIVRHVVFSPNGKRVVTAAVDATLRLWDAETGELLGVLRGHEHLFADECPPVFTPDGSRLVSGSAEGTLRIWEISQVERNILRGHEDFVYDVAFSPDGEQVASGAWDATIRLWDATTGRQTGLLKCETGIVGSVVYSPDGLRLASNNRHQGVTFWDVASQKAAGAWPMPGGSFDPRAAFSPDGKLLASASATGAVHLWDVAAGREVAKLDGHRNTSLDVAFHPDGSLLASTGAFWDRTVRLWDVAKRAPIAVLEGHTDAVWRVAFSANGKLLASCSNDKTLRLWDPQTHEQLVVIPMGTIVYGVAFSPDGTRLAAGCGDNTVRLLDVASREQVAELRGHVDYVHAVAWSPDGTRLISGSGDATVRVWDSLSPVERAGRPPGPGRPAR